jgi:regulator of sirC expression with transglutaminase-like and TPR domain
VKRRPALALLLTAACARDGDGSGFPLARRALSAGRTFGEGTPDDETSGLAELTRLANEVKRAARTHGSLLLALNASVFGALGFAREVNDPSLAFVLLPSVLKGRRGSCVGLGLLYLSLAELLALPMECIVRPGHFYVRVPNERGHVNAELLRRGEAMPDAWYEERWPIPGGTARAYGRPLSRDEVFGVVAYNVGNQRQASGRLEDARSAFDRATRAFPELAEAHASLGRTLHLLGALAAAEAAYAAARRAHPALPGLEQNVELLRRERAQTGR